MSKAKKLTIRFCQFFLYWFVVYLFMDNTCRYVYAIDFKLFLQYMWESEAEELAMPFFFGSWYFVIFGFFLSYELYLLMSKPVHLIYLGKISRLRTAQMEVGDKHQKEIRVFHKSQFNTSLKKIYEADVIGEKHLIEGTYKRTIQRHEPLYFVFLVPYVVFSTFILFVFTLSIFPYASSDSVLYEHFFHLEFKSYFSLIGYRIGGLVVLVYLSFAGLWSLKDYRSKKWLPKLDKEALPAFTFFDGQTLQAEFCKLYRGRKHRVISI